MANLIVGHTRERSTRIWVWGDARHRAAVLVREKSIDSVRGAPQTKEVSFRKENNYTTVLSFEDLLPATSCSVAERFSGTSSVPGTNGRSRLAHGEVRTHAPYTPAELSSP
jgi:hypothetical protein